jgi:hypothetical protein
MKNQTELDRGWKLYHTYEKAFVKEIIKFSTPDRSQTQSVWRRAGYLM